MSHDTPPFLPTEEQRSIERCTLRLQGTQLSNQSPQALTFRSSNTVMAFFRAAIFSAFSSAGARVFWSRASAYKRAASIQSADGGLVESHAATRNVHARAAVISPTKRVVIVHILQC